MKHLSGESKDMKVGTQQTTSTNQQAQPELQLFKNDISCKEYTAKKDEQKQKTYDLRDRGPLLIKPVKQPKTHSANTFNLNVNNFSKSKNYNITNTNTKDTKIRQTKNTFNLTNPCKKNNNSISNPKQSLILQGNKSATTAEVRSTNQARAEATNIRIAEKIAINLESFADIIKNTKATEPTLKSATPMPIQQTTVPSINPEIPTVAVAVQSTKQEIVSQNKTDIFQVSTDLTANDVDDEKCNSADESKAIYNNRSRSLIASSTKPSSNILKAHKVNVHNSTSNRSKINNDGYNKKKILGKKLCSPPPLSGRDVEQHFETEFVKAEDSESWQIGKISVNKKTFPSQLGQFELEI